MQRSTDATTMILGFGVGFFTGCCGIVAAAFLFPRYLPGALMGFGARFLLAIVWAATSSVPGTVQTLQVDGGRELPWELIGAFVIATVALTAFVAGLIWVVDGFYGQDDDDDDHPGGQAQDPHSYVTYTRR